MPLKGPVLDALSEVQRRRVRENLGLVGLHLRKHVRNLRTPRREREWEDLFQEGCLGLIRAAVDFAPEREIPFAAFALPRIHHAVSLALQSRFTLIRPPRRKERDILEQVLGRYDLCSFNPFEIRRKGRLHVEGRA